MMLVMLLEARKASKFARLLRISLYTAKDHIKAIYRHFGVSGQLELLRRFKYGDGGDLVSGSASPGLTEQIAVERPLQATFDRRCHHPARRAAALDRDD